MIEGEDGESYDLRRSSKLLSTDGDPVEGAEEEEGEEREQWANNTAFLFAANGVQSAAFSIRSIPRVVRGMAPSIRAIFS